MARASKGKSQVNGSGAPAGAAPRGTLELARGYHGQHEEANLANCLLGLLLLTPVALLERLPETPLSHLRSWGVSGRTVRQRGRTARRPHTLRQLVRTLRKSAAQVALRADNGNGRVSALEFHDQGGLQAVIGAADLRRFVERLAMLLQGGDEVDAARARFVASWHSRPYHTRACKWARRISRRNLRGLRNRRAALHGGHRPCKVCKP